MHCSPLLCVATFVMPFAMRPLSELSRCQHHAPTTVSYLLELPLFIKYQPLVFCYNNSKWTKRTTSTGSSQLHLVFCIHIIVFSPNPNLFINLCIFCCGRFFLILACLLACYLAHFLHIYFYHTYFSIYLCILFILSFLQVH
jgi:hypothetical protein